MMPQPAARSNRQAYDVPRSCTTRVVSFSISETVRLAAMAGSSAIDATCHEGTSLALFLRQRLRDFTSLLDEEPRDWARGPVLEGDDADRRWGRRDVDGQDPYLRPSARKSQDRVRENR